MSRRVVITGLGPVTAYGVGMEPLWNAMLEGRSAIAPIRQFDASGFTCRAAAELSDDLLDIRQIVPKFYRKNLKVMCRDIELAVAAADAAIRSAGLVTRGVDADAPPTIAPNRFGCHIGAGLIAADPQELGAALVSSRAADGTFDLRDWGAQGMQNLTPLWLLKYLPNMLACHVTIIHDCRGPSNTITCCEASALLSIGESMRVIRRGVSDACLSGGAEHKLNPMAYMRQEFAERLVETGDHPEPATLVRPFDARAAGTIVGTGGGLLLLEALDSAEARGAAPIAELTGFAATQSLRPDVRGLETAPDDEALADAIELALGRAGIGADEIDAIVPFGSSLPQMDGVEAAAIKQVFAERAATTELITTIPFAGNCQAGNAAIAVCAAAEALRSGRLPARLHTEDADGLCAAAAPARDADLRNVLVLTTSQGGQNAALVVRRFS